jgi:hypothetical protein
MRATCLCVSECVCASVCLCVCLFIVCVSLSFSLSHQVPLGVDNRQLPLLAALHQLVGLREGAALLGNDEIAGHDLRHGQRVITLDGPTNSAASSEEIAE